MLKDLPLLAHAGDMARHAAARHAVIAQNVANADTPGYRARDLAPFAELMVDTRRGRRIDDARLERAHEVEGLDGSPNGNTVSIEDQTARAVDAQAQHQAALSIYRKAIELLRMSLSARF